MKKLRTDTRFKHHEAYFFINKLDPEKEKKLENVTEKKRIQPCGYQWEREVGRGKIRGGGTEVQSTM